MRTLKKIILGTSLSVATLLGLGQLGRNEYTNGRVTNERGTILNKEGVHQTYFLEIESFGRRNQYEVIEEGGVSLLDLESKIKVGDKVEYKLKTHKEPYFKDDPDNIGEDNLFYIPSNKLNIKGDK